MTDEATFSAWARDRQLALLRTAALLTGDHHRAEDLVQHALTKVALRWRRLHAGISWWRKHQREGGARRRRRTPGGRRVGAREFLRVTAIDGAATSSFARLYGR